MTVHHGDCRAILATFADASIDAIVTDPPYELGFMGKHWDASGIAYDPVLWSECLRVLKPGGHLLAFGGTRTYHRMAVAIEDAGFEVRDSIHWLYGSGFPKSLDVSKAIDKAAGAEREVVGEGPYSARRPRMDVSAVNAYSDGVGDYGSSLVTAPATDAARQWEGWGTALKPAHEPIVVARKPLIGTVAANVLEHGTGALNIDGCRVDGVPRTTHAHGNITGVQSGKVAYSPLGAGYSSQAPSGRWPSNLVFTHAAECADVCVPGCPVAELDEQSGVSKSPPVGYVANIQDHKSDRCMSGGVKKGGPTMLGYGDQGGASRFFTVTEWDVPFRYIAKPSKRERNAGLGALPEQAVHRLGAGIGEGHDPAAPALDRNHHPTVKPLALMRWLVRLVTPPGGIVLDPFLGSGTTAAAAVLEGFDWVGCEMTAEYLPIIEGRVAWAHEQAGKPAEAHRSDEVLPFEQLDLFGGEAA